MPTSSPSRASEVDSAAMRELNVQAARASLVLLKNENKLLPLDKSKLRTVGVIGPTRMHYSRTIALVDGTTQAVSRVLREAH